MLECRFCGSILSRRHWHSSSAYNKVIWRCVTGTKKAKKYCPKSKGLEEKAIEQAFLESYRQICKDNVSITKEFLKVVEEELKDDSLEKDLKKLDKELSKIHKQEKEILKMRLNKTICVDIYTVFVKINCNKKNDHPKAEPMKKSLHKKSIIII